MITNKKPMIAAAATLFAVSIMLFLPFSGLGKGENKTKIIKGVVPEAFETLPEQVWGTEGMMPGGGFGPGAPGGGPGGPGGMSGMPEGMPGGPGGPGGRTQPTPAVYIDNGEYMKAKSKTSVVKEGEIEDAYADKVIIDAEGSGTGGVYVKGAKSRFTLTGADIALSGDINGLGGPGSGAAADDHSTLILRNVNITANGVSRSATSAENFSTLIVNNCTLRANGVPFDATDTSPPGPLEMEGNARAHVTMSGSESYFYNSTIISEGWGALSTDASGGYVYLEANNCNIQAVKSGYATYADHYCMDVFNSCKVTTGSYTVILDKNGIIYLNDIDATSGKNCALIHNSGMPATVISTLKIKGGRIETREALIKVKSTNTDIIFDGVKLISKNNILIQSQINEDESLPRPTEGQKVYGIHASFKDMNVAGNIVHNDPERNMYINLESTKLKGTINDANVYLTIDAASKWVATADSEVTIVGRVDVAQIDAPEGVTITAAAGESGTYPLASGGVLRLKVNPA